MMWLLLPLRLHLIMLLMTKIQKKKKTIFVPASRLMLKPWNILLLNASYPEGWLHSIGVEKPRSYTTGKYLRLRRSHLTPSVRMFDLERDSKSVALVRDVTFALTRIWSLFVRHVDRSAVSFLSLFLSNILFFKRAWGEDETNLHPLRYFLQIITRHSPNSRDRFGTKFARASTEDFSAEL